MKLNIDERDRLVEGVMRALREAVPGSIAELIGSLAEDRADQYSDIDVLWEVPDSSLLGSTRRIGEILGRIRPVASLRSDPGFQDSDKRRVIYVQFEDTPLFWRVDINVVARSIGRDFSYDVRNQAARGDHWSPYHSALMNAVATIKALKRGKTQEASALMARAFNRVGLEAPGLGPGESIPVLLKAVTTMDPMQRRLAEQVATLNEHVLRSDVGNDDRAKLPGFFSGSSGGTGY